MSSGSLADRLALLSLLGAYSALLLLGLAAENLPHETGGGSGCGALVFLGLALIPSPFLLHTLIVWEDRSALWRSRRLLVGATAGIPIALLAGPIAQETGGAICFDLIVFVFTLLIGAGILAESRHRWVVTRSPR